MDVFVLSFFFLVSVSVHSKYIILCANANKIDFEKRTEKNGDQRIKNEARSVEEGRF